MSKEEKNRTEVEELGEFGLIAHLTKSLKSKHKSTIKGVGDDAAVISGNDEEYILLTKDLLNEGVHFDMIYTPLKHLGYKSAIVNFSDIYAMNGTPEQMIIGISISNRYSIEAIEEIYEGIKLACDMYNVDLVGGDTTSSLSGLGISITVLGKVRKDSLVYRSGAKEGDLIFVSGDLGGAYMGLLLLEREKKAYEADPNMQPDLSGNDYILERQLKPEARKDIVSLLKEKGVVPTSMIDISDGLASECMHLCSQSDLGCAIYEDKIPIDTSTSMKASEFGLEPVTCALNGGEDYELLFTIDQKDYEKLKDIKDIQAIGHMTASNEGLHLITASETTIPLQAQGWDALRKRKI